MIESICQQIYEACKGFGPGHLVWYPVPHLEDVPRILDVDRATSQDHYATKFQIRQVTNDDFKKRQKLPIKALSLGETEELLIHKAKRRPCVIISMPNTEDAADAKAVGVAARRHLLDRSMTLLPIYGIETADDPRGFPPIMVARIRCLLYDQFFYLPAKCPKTNQSIRQDGIVRLDRAFAGVPSRAAEPWNIKLHPEPFGLLMAMIRMRFGAAPTEDFKIVRELLKEALPK